VLRGRSRAKSRSARAGNSSSARSRAAPWSAPSAAGGAPRGVPVCSRTPPARVPARERPRTRRVLCGERLERQDVRALEEDLAAGEARRFHEISEGHAGRLSPDTRAPRVGRIGVPLQEGFTLRLAVEDQPLGGLTVKVSPNAGRRYVPSPGSKSARQCADQRRVARGEQLPRLVFSRVRDCQCREIS